MVAVPITDDGVVAARHNGLQLLSELTIFDKYARYRERERRRETWDEVVARNVAMHCGRYPALRHDIQALYRDFVYPRLVLPSMRSLQFAGKPIELNPARIHNCAALPIDDPRAFREIMFLLLGGTGVGFSVQHAHINRLPPVQQPTRSRRYVIQDSIMGWCEAVDALIGAYLRGRPRPSFDYRDIRPRGARLRTSGGRAPGPDGLRKALEAVEQRLARMQHGHQMRSIEIHDIVCLLARAVLSGGIRRSAMISLFDFDDDEMIDAKAGEWWVHDGQRSVANNSAVALRHRITRQDFDHYMRRVEDNGSGEPAIYWANDLNSLTNPCFRGDTLITTSQGLRRIDSLVGETADVWDGERWIECSNFRVTGENQPTMEIELHDGSSIVVTPRHTMMLEDGTRLEARHLSVDDRLAVGNTNCVGTVKAAGAYLKGFLIGDGTTTGGDAALYLYHAGPKIVCADRLARSAQEIDTSDADVRALAEVSWRRDGVRSCLKGLAARRLTSWSTEAKRSFPEEVFRWGRQSRADFIAGVMDADGTALDSNNGFAYQITSIHREWLTGFQSLLKTIGVQSTLRSSRDGGLRDMPGETWRLSISQDSSIRLAREVTFQRLTSFADRESVYDVKPRWNRVAAIRRAAVEQRVYCCTIVTTNSLTIGSGVQIGQCVEASVNLNFCNLTTMNFAAVESQRDVEEFARAAAFLGTLQAGYTDFHYLRDVWQRRTEREALLGVSMTGVARHDLQRFDLRRAAGVVVETNERIADRIGINRAYRTTVNKPEGTSSAVLGTSSGVHAWHDRYFLRRTRYPRDSLLIQYLRGIMPDNVEDDRRDDTLAVVTLPCRAPDGAVTRDESMDQFLDRVRWLSNQWVRPGHRKGHNGHSISATVSVRPDRWGDLRDWMWRNRDHYNGLSVLPYCGGTYEQAPFESIDRSRYERMARSLPRALRLDRIVEHDDETTRQQEAACAGGACQV